MDKKKIMNILSQVVDPELNIPITDLGLIYGVKSQKDSVDITMTLTTIGCPLFSLIETEVKNKLQTLGFEDSNININLTFDPPWSIEKMSERAKAIIGI